MSKRRVTFGKLQRERDKQAKQAAKRDRRAARLEESDNDETPEVSPPTDQTALLEALAALHDAYEAGRMGIDEFEEQRDELRSRLRVD